MAGAKRDLDLRNNVDLGWDKCQGQHLAWQSFITSSESERMVSLQSLQHFSFVSKIWKKSITSKLSAALVSSIGAGEAVCCLYAADLLWSNLNTRSMRNGTCQMFG